MHFESMMHPMSQNLSLLRLFQNKYKIRGLSKLLQQRFIETWFMSNCTKRFSWNKLSHSYCTHAIPENLLMRHLTARIKASGPLPIAEFMKEVLTNPVAGYYMKKDVFGQKGDFTTSPEISQLFGEMIAVFCVSEWQNAGCPEKIQVVELGPGRGSLSADMLRIFSQFPEFNKAVSLHLVEISSAMIKLQTEKLSNHVDEEEEKENKNKDEKETDTSSRNKLYEHKSIRGPSVHWYKHLNEVPKEFSFFVAHEFLDALPIYKFQKKDDNWHEVLVDLDENGQLQFVLSRGPTFNSVAFLKHLNPSDQREHIEVSPQSGVIVQEIATRIQHYGGFGLLADYGHDGDKTDTLRGFKNHQLHDVLTDVGSADVTADVDYSYIRHCCQPYVQSYGPITQQQFLNNMGIGLRLKNLFEKATEEQQQDLLTSVRMMMDPKQMGEVFKFLAMLPKTTKSDYVPTGFRMLKVNKSS